MEPFHARLIEEQVQLQERVDKLTEFFKSDKITLIDNVQSSLLHAQIFAMSAYNQILIERIKWLNGGKTGK